MESPIQDVSPDVSKKVKLVAIIFGIVATVLLLPMIIIMMKNIVVAFGLLFILFILYYMAPAVGEWAAQLGKRGQIAAVENDPIAALYRERQGSAENISNIEKEINDSEGAVDTAKSIIEKKAKILKPTALENIQNQIKEYEGYISDLRKLLKEEYEKHEQFEAEIASFEAQFEIAEAFGDAGKRFDFSKKVGANSERAQIAAKEITSRLASSRASMRTIRERPKLNLG